MSNEVQVKKLTDIMAQFVGYRCITVLGKMWNKIPTD